MSKPAELLQPPPPTMREKVGPRAATFDADAIAKAESALKGLSENFHAWLADDVNRLDSARLAARATLFSEATTEEIFCRAHDVKGLGATYDYPLATQIAGSLCRLTETPAMRVIAARAPTLIEAHVDALRAIVRDRIQDPEHKTARALADALGASVEALIGPEVA